MQYKVENFYYKWDENKDNNLIQTRNISFIDIIYAIKNKMVLEIIDNPSGNFNNQKCFVINIDNYAYLVPFIISGNDIFLKTIYPSRKFSSIYNLK